MSTDDNRMNGVTRKWAKANNHAVYFTHRDYMKRAGLKKAHNPKGGIPTTTLPVDGTNNAQCVWLMDGNDTYGDCGSAMADHGFQRVDVGESGQ